VSAQLQLTNISASMIETFCYNKQQTLVLLMVVIYKGNISLSYF